MCKQGYFSFKNTDEYCSECPKNALCNKNGSFINVTFGFWKSDYFSLNIFECKIPEACIGEGKCSEGYEGLLCDSCYVGNDVQYYKNASNQCQICNQSLIPFFLVGIV